MNDIGIPLCLGVDRQRSRTASAFTLLEVLVSLVIFGIITLALALALASSLQTESSIQAHQQQSGTVRAVFNLVTRDIQAAFGSQNNPNALFIGNGSSAGGNSGAGSLLMLSNLAHRIQADDMAGGAPGPGGATTAASQTQNGPPPAIQSDWELVRYDLDSRLGTLRRSVVTAPNLQAIQMPPDQGVKSVVADNVISLTFRYWDGGQQTWRDSWDYEQQNQPSSSASTPSGQTGATGQQSSTGATQQSATAPTSSSNNSSNGDAVLPTAVEVTLVLRAKDGTPLTYTTEIPVVASQPQDSGIGTANPTSPTGSTTTGNTGSGTAGSGTQ